VKLVQEGLAHARSWVQNDVSPALSASAAVAVRGKQPDGSGTAAAAGSLEQQGYECSGQRSGKRSGKRSGEHSGSPHR